MSTEKGESHQTAAEGQTVTNNQANEPVDTVASSNTATSVQREAFVPKPIPEGAPSEVAFAIILENIENHSKKIAADLARDNARADQVIREINQRISQQAEETKQQISQTENALMAHASGIAEEQNQRQKGIIEAIANHTKQTMADMAGLRKDGETLATEVAMQRAELN